MKESINIAVNHEVLVWAREAIVLNRTNTSEKIGISAKRLIQLEEGEKQPTLDELKELSKAYKRTIATLLLTTPPKEKPFSSNSKSLSETKVNIQLFERHSCI